MTKPAQFQQVPRVAPSDALRLLDLDGLAVDRIEADAFGGRLVHVVTSDEMACVCPGCGCSPTRSRDMSPLIHAIPDRKIKGERAGLSADRTGWCPANVVVWVENWGQAAGSE